MYLSLNVYPILYINYILINIYINNYIYIIEATLRSHEHAVIKDIDKCFDSQLTHC